VNPGEQLSQAQGNKADQTQGAKTPGFDKQAFVNALLDKVRATAPKSLEHALAAIDHDPALAVAQHDDR
jgi:hypothetical protein